MHIYIYTYTCTHMMIVLSIVLFRIKYIHIPANLPRCLFSLCVRVDPLLSILRFMNVAAHVMRTAPVSLGPTGCHSARTKRREAGLP